MGRFGCWIGGGLDGGDPPHGCCVRPDGGAGDLLSAAVSDRSVPLFSYTEMSFWLAR